MEKHIKLKTGRSLAMAIDSIVNESIKQSLYQNAVDEKAKQVKLSEEDDDLFDSEESAEKKPDSSKTVDSEKEKMKKGEITVDDIVTKLNTIRGGKSFKDEAIAGKLDEYFNSLSKAEKTALMAFLKGLSQIVTGEVEASQAVEPSSAPADVEMKKKDAGEKKTKSIKPTVIKAPEKEKSEKKPSSEDTSAPVPITPKKK